MPSTPFSRPFAGTADGTGAALIPIAAVSTVAYFFGYIVAASGALTTYQLQDYPAGNALAGSIGVTAVIGPLRLNPGDKAQLAVAGAPAGAVVNCMLLGDLAADPNDLSRMVAPTQGGQQVTATGGGGGAPPGSKTLVSKGAVAVNAGASITPAFGQPTTAGNLLIACVGCNNLNGIGVGGGAGGDGWQLAASKLPPSNIQVGIFYKLNCGAAEGAPTFSSLTASNIKAQLAEFAGASKFRALDNSARGTSAGGSPITATSPAVDTAVGDLIVTAAFWIMTAASGGVLTTTYGANATAILLGTAQDNFYALQNNFAITTGNAIADTDTETNSLANASTQAVVLASFL
jgi:hypothetical protein